MLTVLTLEEMLLRLGVAILLGAVVGLEREMVGKRAGVRTSIMVAAGSAIFAIISLAVPFVAGVSEEAIQNTLPDRVLANIVVGVGFLGAGIIVKEGLRVRGLTTAATIWFVAAIGTLAGIGLIKFAVISSIGLTLLLFILRKIDLYRILHGKEAIEEGEDENAG